MLPLRISIESIRRVIDTNGSRPVVVLVDDLEDYACKYDASSKLISEYLAHCFLRIWELPILDAAIVQILPEHVGTSILSNRTQLHHFNKPCFGLRYNNLATDASNLLVGLKSDYNELQKFQNRYDLLKIGLFDLWIANTDRSINNYNLLINSNKGYYEITPIDHSDIFDGCRLGQDLAQLTEYDSILSSDLAKTLLYNNKKIAEETRLLLNNFPNFVTACNNALPEIVAGIPNDWCSDKGTLHEQIKSSIIDNATWIADTKANFKELVAEYIIKR